MQGCSQAVLFPSCLSPCLQTGWNLTGTKLKRKNVRTAMRTSTRHHCKKMGQRRSLEKKLREELINSFNTLTVFTHLGDSDEPRLPIWNSHPSLLDLWRWQYGHTIPRFLLQELQLGCLWIRDEMAWHGAWTSRVFLFFLIAIKCGCSFFQAIEALFEHYYTSVPRLVIWLSVMSCFLYRETLTSRELTTPWFTCRTMGRSSEQVMTFFVYPPIILRHNSTVVNFPVLSPSLPDVCLSWFITSKRHPALQVALSCMPYLFGVHHVYQPRARH